MHTIEVISQNGKNYFQIFYQNKRFLLTRIKAQVLAQDNNLEIYRSGCIVLSLYCYKSLGKYPIFLINYSELTDYRETNNIYCPCECLYADDFLPEDSICCLATDLHETIGKACSFILSLCTIVERSMNKLSRVFNQTEINAKVMCGDNPVNFELIKTNLQVLDIQTFIVPNEIFA